MQALHQQLESFSERLVDGLTQLEGVSSSSMRQLQEESATLAEAVAVSVCCCSRGSLHRMGSLL
jgi:hypothetical protein